ncbi:MAG: hypothetical protein ACRETW_08460 [Stenotrophobium sp.]
MARAHRAAIFFGSFTLLAMCFSPGAFAAAKPAITRVSATARPEVFNGECPAALEFVGTIRVSKHPVTVEYVWERSNSSRSAVRRIQVRSAVQLITDEWSVGGPSGQMQVWEKLTILSPVNIASAKAMATVNCK